ncbi:MAG TPA: hypothetical protein VJN43_11245 [Bryobacteraceae bacterium]|nr:hypothetical protein [Bryobacteraceae bacterium]
MEPDNHDYQVESGQLDRLFGAYRDACPDPDVSPNFMPQLWQKIEAQERVSNVFGRFARNLVTAALAASTLLALAASIERSRMTAPLPSETYVEVLAEEHARQDMDYFEPVRIEPAADQR